jgi:hypothetical protein
MQKAAIKQPPGQGQRKCGLKGFFTGRRCPTPTESRLYNLKFSSIDCGCQLCLFETLGGMNEGLQTEQSEGYEPAPAPNSKENAASWGKVGRNEVCPCGSGKKFKHCHGRYQ